MSLDKLSPGPILGRIGLIGDCDHGFWQQSTGKIVTAGDVEIPLRGSAPASFPDSFTFEGTTGDSVAVRVPGTPPVTRTPEELAADTAAGRTWLDYGILAGGQRRLYGHQLGGMSWIYAAPDGSRWLMRIVGGDVTATRFGVVSSPAAEPVVVQAMTLDVTVPSPGSFKLLYAIDDVNSDGSEIALVAGLFASVWVETPKRWLRYVSKVWRVSVSGIPPAASISVTLEQDGIQIGSLVQDKSGMTDNGWLQYSGEVDGEVVYSYLQWTIPPPAAPGGMTLYGQYLNPQGQLKETSTFCLGAAFIDDVFQLIKLQQFQSSTSTYSYDAADLAALAGGAVTLPYSGSFTVETKVRLYVGDVPLESVISDAGGVSGVLNRDLSKTRAAASDGLATLDGATVNTPPNADASAYFANWIEATIGHFWFWPYRLSNRAWSLCAYNLGAEFSWPNGGGLHWHIGIASPSEQRKLSRQVAIDATTSAIHGYASVHPVTDELEWSSAAPVCWL